MEKLKTIHQLKDEILARLYHSSDVDIAVNEVIKVIGIYFNVSRVYIFENSEDDLCTSNTFEWCNEGIRSEIQNLQNVRYLEDMGGTWYDNYDEEGLFFCQDIGTLPLQQQEVLRPQGICGMLQCAIRENGIYKGFIGFDNCDRKNQNWKMDSEAVETLVFISRLLSIFLLQQRGKTRLARSKEELENALVLANANNRISTEEAALYQSVVEGSDTAVVIVQKKEQKILFANKAWKNLEGFSAEDDIVGSNMFEILAEKKIIFSEEEVTQLPYDSYRTFHKILSNGVYLQISVRAIHWNGTECYISYIIDETEIQKSKERLKKLIDEVPGGIIVCKINQGQLYLDYVNDGFLRMLGDTRKAREKFLGDKVLEAIHPKDHKIIFQMIQQFQQGEDLQDVIYRIKNGAGEYYWIRLVASVVDRNQDTIVLYGSVSDVDEIEEKQKQELNEALNRVKEANNAKTEFFSRMSHDMRTPMNGILGLASLSEEEENAEILKENISKIRTSGEYLLGLINDTLDFQKIESGKMKISPQITECSSFIENMLEMVKVSAKEKKIELKVEIDYQSIQGYVQIDPIRMKQVFLNLLSNAIKFTPEYGIVGFQISCRQKAANVKHVLVTVWDTGIGMSEEFLQNKIFKSFTQEYNQMSAQYAGSGLGLSIVKKLVDMMGGTIKVESTLGQGTAFTIEMDVETVTPLDTIGQVTKGEAQKSVTRENLCGRRILLVEDHALNAEIAKRLLQKAGCSVVWVENGRLGVTEFMRSEPGYYDAILMDIRMPVMDGLEAAKSIRDLPRRDAGVIPIIAMTANAYDDDVSKSKEAGMNAHLSKPIDTQKLYETLGTYIGMLSSQLVSTGVNKKEEIEINIETLKKMVRYVWKERGALAVAYGSFNSIYQFLERNLVRTKQNVQIILFTVRDKRGNIPTHIELKPVMDVLSHSVQYSLRTGDLMMEYNVNQLTIILVNCDAVNGEMVVERILNVYNQNSSENDMQIHYEISGIQDATEEELSR
ncbi:MAG: ATP-binding protein [Hespellia sp.]|nr:ATP-binding protein [Hespellia sp.]